MQKKISGSQIIDLKNMDRQVGFLFFVFIFRKLLKHNFLLRYYRDCDLQCIHVKFENLKRGRSPSLTLEKEGDCARTIFRGIFSEFSRHYNSNNCNIVIHFNDLLHFTFPALFSNWCKFNLKCWLMLSFSHSSQNKQFYF